MRGSINWRSHLQHSIALAFVGSTLVSLLWAATPAQAHVLSNFMLERAHIANRARAEIGVPYAYGGSSPAGFDCSGLTRWVFGGHGAWLPHNALAQFYLAGRPGYRRVWNRRYLTVGDLVFFKTTGARVGHAGVYIGHGLFISATSSSGVRIQSVWDRYYWGPRWVGATRLPVERHF